MISELCPDRPLNTLQIVCSTAPLPSAECQDSTPTVPRRHFPCCSSSTDTAVLSVWAQTAFHTVCKISHLVKGKTSVFTKDA